MGTFLRDFHYGRRMLLKNPGFAAAAIATLAIGIAPTPQSSEWRTDCFGNRQPCLSRTGW